MNIFKALRIGKGKAILPSQSKYCYREIDGRFYFSDSLHAVNNVDVDFSIDQVVPTQYLERDDWQPDC